MYAQLVKLIKNRKDLTPDHVEQLEEIVMDSAKASAIYEASKSSMGVYNILFWIERLLRLVRITT